MWKSISGEPFATDRNSGHEIGKAAPGCPCNCGASPAQPAARRLTETPTQGATMTGLRGSAHHTLATPTRLAVRPITLALGALLVTAVLAVAIVLATSGGSDQAGATKSDSVAPSTPLPPSAAQHHQPPGVNGPGARP
jgi:hypothetical protein